MNCRICGQPDAGVECPACEYKKCKAEERRLKWERFLRTIKHLGAKVPSAYLQTAAFVRRRLDRLFGDSGTAANRWVRLVQALVLFVLVCFCVILPVALLFELRGDVMFCVAGFAGTMVVLLLFCPSDEGLQSRIADLHDMRSSRNARRQELSRQIVAVRQQGREALARWNALRAEQDEETQRLLQQPWQFLSDTAFEAFVRDVFLHLGFKVRKPRPDRGTDVLAELPDGTKLSIQCKGGESSVGWDAVKEASAGMQYHGCTTCVAITNSRFHKNAHEAAERLNCTLIWGEKIEALIRGRVALPTKTPFTPAVQHERAMSASASAAVFGGAFMLVIGVVVFVLGGFKGEGLPRDGRFDSSQARDGTSRVPPRDSTEPAVVETEPPQGPVSGQPFLDFTPNTPAPARNTAPRPVGVAPRSPPPLSNLFAPAADARFVVFVLSTSGALNPYDEFIRVQLAAAVMKLGADQSFNVVFAGKEPAPVFHKGVPPTKDNVDWCLAVLLRVDFLGTSDADRAVAVAAAMQPDVIQCVLSRDVAAELSESLVARYGRGFRVDVSAVGSDSFGNARSLAGAFRGKFQAVDPARLAVDPVVAATLREWAERPAEPMEPAESATKPNSSSTPVGGVPPASPKEPNTGEMTLADWIAQLKAPEPMKRAQAAFALARLGAYAKPAIPALKAALRDRDPNVHMAVEFALKRIDQ